MPLMVWIVRKMLRQPLAGVRVLLERDQVPVELVEVLVTLDEELLDDLVQTVHGGAFSLASQPGRRPGWSSADRRWRHVHPPAVGPSCLLSAPAGAIGPPAAFPSQ